MGQDTEATDPIAVHRAAVRVMDDDATCNLEEYREQVTEIKAELAMLKTYLLASDVPTDDPIMQDQARVERLVFDHLLKIKEAPS